jgi:hypothetical protein
MQRGAIRAQLEAGDALICESSVSRQPSLSEYTLCIRMAYLTGRGVWKRSGQEEEEDPPLAALANAHASTTADTPAVPAKESAGKEGQEKIPSGGVSTTVDEKTPPPQDAGGAQLRKRR